MLFLLLVSLHTGFFLVTIDVVCLLCLVRMTREAALDSQVVAQLAQLGHQKAQALQTDTVVFEPVDFCDKLMMFLSGKSQAETDLHGISNQGWIRLGEAVQPFFKRSPAIHFM